jgi:hypothetical protein
MRDRLDTRVLAAVWDAKFSVLLRSWQLVHHRRSVDGKRADIFLAGHWAVVVPDFICGRPGEHSDRGEAFDRRHRVYVRSPDPFTDSIVEPVSCRDASTIAMGNSTFRLRPERVEVSNADCLDGSSDQLFLASGIRCKLGSRAVLSRTARPAGNCLYTDISDCCSSRDLLSHASIPYLVCQTATAKDLVIVSVIHSCRPLATGSAKPIPSAPDWLRYEWSQYLHRQ